MLEVVCVWGVGWGGGGRHACQMVCARVSNRVANRIIDELELRLRAECIIAACGHVALTLKQYHARDLGFEGGCTRIASG